MNAAFFSNFLNHHQLPFYLAMDKLTEGKFTFVATTPVPQERLQIAVAHRLSGLKQEHRNRLQLPSIVLFVIMGKQMNWQVC